MNNKTNINNSTNFIRNRINNDFDSGLHSSIKTRLPYETNGYLYIGHAKSVCLNFGMAKD
jgi:glutaminyl-tRNA synthetase